MLDAEVRRRARDRANEMGISLAEYIRRLLDRDLGRPEGVADPARVFDLGDSGGSNVAVEKDAMVGKAVRRGNR